MKLLSGIITLLLAIAISVVAAYFSVVGLAALFAATFIPVVIMGSVLEAGKLVTAQWLHSNWANPRVNFLHKSYLVLAVAALMLITAIGIYGFLSKGHLEQEAPLAGVQVQVAQKEQMIRLLESDNSRLQVKMDQLDANIDSFLKGDKAERANTIRNRQKKERAEIEGAIAENTEKIQALYSDIVPLKLKTSEVEAKLGPIKYVADLFGWEDVNSAVRLVILILMFAFDPLAIVMMLSATITFHDYFDERRARKQNNSDGSPPDEIPPPPKGDDHREPFIVAEENVDGDLMEPIIEPTKTEVAYIKDVIDSGNATPEAEVEVAELVKPEPKIKRARTPAKPRKTRKKKQPSPSTENPESYNVALANFVKMAYMNSNQAAEQERLSVLELLSRNDDEPKEQVVNDTADDVIADAVSVDSPTDATQTNAPNKRNEQSPSRSSWIGKRLVQTK